MGRAVVDEARAAGHEVTTFTRRTVVSGAEAVHGDRADARDLAGLARRGPWDVVVDTSGMVPRDVLSSAQALVGSAGRYVFVSTVNVYTGWPTVPLDEGSPVRECAHDDAGGERQGETYGDRYGRLKAGCERAALEVFGRRAAVLRPGVILGPREYIGRLAWWLGRMKRGGRVLAPGEPGREIQPVDVRDVAGFALMPGLEGVYNVTAPFGHASYRELLEACSSAAGGHARLVWVPDDFLVERDVPMWTGLPLWRVFPGTWRISSRAWSSGLVCRPLADTVADTWAWITGGGDVVASHRAGEMGISSTWERELLAEWDTQTVSAR
ncbi:NAD-dependent epimerase/dehydratase family protein [Actinocorallia aurea]